MNANLTIATNATPALPDLAETREGFTFNPDRDVWIIDSLVGRNIYDFGQFDKLDRDVVLRLKLTLVWQLAHKSPSHCWNMFINFVVMYNKVIANEKAVTSKITLRYILRFKSTLDEKTEWKLGVVRVLFKHMKQMRLGILEDSAMDYLSSSTIRGNIKGTSIRTRDPLTGALNDLELTKIQADLNRAFSDEDIDLYNFAYAWLLLAYGMRTIQIAAMKESDLIVRGDGDDRSYALLVPRGKQRAGIRASMKMRYCSKQIGQLLETVIASNVSRRQGDPSRPEGLDWPLFMSYVEGNLPDLLYHIPSNEIGRSVNRTLGQITGIKSNPRRFRNTLAQRAVDDGEDIYTVAELLDHSDIQNAHVYFEAGPAMVIRLDEKLALELAPVAQAFAGLGVVTERTGAVGNRIYDRSLQDNVAERVGDCGQMSFCGLSLPYACYTCRHFQPWIDGPHEEFLSALVADRQRMIDERYSPRIYSMRDRTILAVGEVVRLCESARSKIEGDDQ